MPPTGFAPAKLVTGASALVAATAVERGFGFLANLLAARLGGASVYGAYSLALTTANNIAAYAGAGIGSTATRFSGTYSDGTAGARALARALTLVSAVSAVLAVGILFAGAGPLARVLLAQPGLEGLLRWASVSAGVMILVECCRGFLVGQRRLSTLLLFSAVIGGAMVVALPMAARVGAKAGTDRAATLMIAVQAAAGLLALAAVFVLARRSTRTVRPDGGASAGRVAAKPVGLGELIGKVWRFGFVQLLGIVGLNAAGWWVASLVTRADRTMFQMGLFAVASQMRNLVALIPGLLTQSSYPMLADEAGEPNRVLSFCTVVAAVMALLVGGAAIVVLPWVLPLAWGRGYGAGVLAAVLGIATAIVHMSGSGAAARLTIVSLRWTGVINAIWSVAVACGAAVLLIGPAGWSAATVAMALYLGAHTLSVVLVLVALGRAHALPRGFVGMTAAPVVAALALSALAAWRVSAPIAASLEVIVVLAGTSYLLGAARRDGFTASDVFGPAKNLLRRLGWRWGVAGAAA